MNLEDIVRSIRNKFSFKKAGHAILAAAEAVGSRPYPGQPSTSLSGAQNYAVYYDRSSVNQLMRSLQCVNGSGYADYQGLADMAQTTPIWDPDEGRKVLGPLQDSLGVIDTRSEI